MSSKMVTIKEAEYQRLLCESDFLNCLRAAGVDNWDGYDYACELAGFSSEDEEDED